MSNEQTQSVEAPALEDDAFVQGLKARMPDEIRDSFTDEQLHALRLAFGTRSWNRHAIDLRGTLPSWRYRYYFVILAGRNKRGGTRRGYELGLAAKAMMATAFLAFCLLVGLVVLYVLKSALGINLFPGFSLGLWDWLKTH